MTAPQRAVDLRALIGSTALPMRSDLKVTGLAMDSRAVQPGDLFLACPGSRRHGSMFIPEAIKRGAAAVLVDTSESTWAADKDKYGVPVFPIPDLRRRVGFIADSFYSKPSAELHVIGITGTNGKTSVSHYLAQALDAGDARRCGVVGTLGCGFLEALVPTGLTTPDPITLHRGFRQMQERGARSVAIEVSSHALLQDRVQGVRFDTAVFTNLSHDHLDYHTDMQSYAYAKELLFLQPGLKSAVINLDDDFGRRLPARIPRSVSVIGYTLDGRQHPGCRVLSADILCMSKAGLELDIGFSGERIRLKVELLGRFSAGNVLAGVAALLASGDSLETAGRRMAGLKPVRGRMEVFGDARQPTVIVDYAHTPDALRQALQTLREICPGRLFCVFGCGGDRDREKRPLMGRIASENADVVVVTDDNPRNEDPDNIVRMILKGIEKPTIVEHDRRRAIETSLSMAAVDDLILVAGKGHENYQEIKGERRDFSDQQVVRDCLMRRAS